MRNLAVIAVLRRVTPISDQVDTVAKTFTDEQQLAEVLRWAEKSCKGCVMFSLELIRDEQATGDAGEGNR